MEARIRNGRTFWRQKLNFSKILEGCAQVLLQGPVWPTIPQMGIHPEKKIWSVHYVVRAVPRGIYTATHLRDIAYWPCGHNTIAKVDVNLCLHRRQHNSHPDDIGFSMSFPIPLHALLVTCTVHYVKHCA
jgi:hypothetical protein